MELSGEGFTMPDRRGVYEATPARSGALSFNDLVRELWENWLILLICLIVALAVAFGITVNTTPKYAAQIKVAPAESNFSATGATGQNVLSTATGQGFLAALTGGRQQYDDYTHFLDLLHSVRLAEQLERQYGVMKEVFPYDSVNQRFVPSPELFQRLIRAVRTAIGLPAWLPPGPVDLARYLTEYVEIDRHADSSATITYRHPDADQGRTFLERVYFEIDWLMRDEKLCAREALQRYVTERLARTPGLDQRAMLIQLWGMEETQMLLLTSGDPVGARMIDDVSVPNLPSADSLFVFAISLASGLLIGMVIVIGRSALKRA